MKSSPCPITIDSREPAHTAWAFSPECIVTRKALPTGDYAPTGFEDRFAIERKAIGDLVACCTWERERFVRELERFAPFEFKCIIVEASIEDVARRNYRANVHPAAVVGSVLAFHIDHGVPTIWAGTPGVAARIAERMMRRFVEKCSAPEVPA
jgi:ERCC4-type nuclease